MSEHPISTAEEAAREALKHLQGPFVQQLDQDGVIVGVSREALEIVCAALLSELSRRERMEEALRKARDFIAHDSKEFMASPLNLIDDLLQGRTATAIRTKNMEDALHKCADQFAFYAQQHRDKGTPDGDAKAVTNDNFEKLARAALSSP